LLKPKPKILSQSHTQVSAPEIFSPQASRPRWDPIVRLTSQITESRKILEEALEEIVQEVNNHSADSDPNNNDSKELKKLIETQFFTRATEINAKNTVEVITGCCFGLTFLHFRLNPGTLNLSKN